MNSYEKKPGVAIVAIDYKNCPRTKVDIIYHKSLNSGDLENLNGTKTILKTRFEDLRRLTSIYNLRFAAIKTRR